MGPVRRKVTVGVFLLLMSGVSGVAQARDRDFAADPGFAVCASPWAGDSGFSKPAPPWPGDPGFTVALLEATPQTPAAPHC